jgi:hypothetical protein
MDRRVVIPLVLASFLLILLISELNLMQRRNDPNFNTSLIMTFVLVIVIVFALVTRKTDE